MSRSVSANSQNLVSDLSMEGQCRTGLVWVWAVFALVCVWGGIAQISGAVLASGRVTLESSTKRIQHREGGIVGDILVREGQRVIAGQVLVKLDPTVVNASAAIVQGQLWQLSARKMRLQAERDSQPSSLLIPPNGSALEYIQMIEAERRLMAARQNSREQQKAQLKEQLAQGAHEIVGLTAQIDSVTHQSELIKQELIGVRSLYERGYAPFTRVSELQRQSEQLQGRLGELVAAIARTKARGAEIAQRSLQVDSQALSEIMSELKDTETKLNQLSEQQVTVRDASTRVELRSPVTGKVQALKVHTRGGIVGPGETLMMIVPEADQLIVEARIDPQKIDEVHIGGKAHVHFTAFDTRTTPEAIARVDMLSSDIETDEKTGAAFYRARLTLEGMKLPELLKRKLVAGMPVEVQIETGSRSAISYFLKPLTDQLNRTFREE